MLRAATFLGNDTLFYDGLVISSMPSLPQWQRAGSGISALLLLVFLPLIKQEVILKSFSSGSSIFLVVVVAFIK